MLSYLDPGTGSMIAAAFAGGMAGFGVLMRVYGHRIMRRRSNEITGEAALRGSRGSAALSGADWALEEVRRRADFSGDDQARVVGAALRLTAEAGQLLSIWRQSPLRVLARLHLVAAADKADAVGRPPRRSSRRTSGRGTKRSRRAPQAGLQSLQTLFLRLITSGVWAPRMSPTRG